MTINLGSSNLGWFAYECNNNRVYLYIVRYLRNNATWGSEMEEELPNHGYCKTKREMIRVIKKLYPNARVCDSLKMHFEV